MDSSPSSPPASCMAPPPSAAWPASCAPPAHMHSWVILPRLVHFFCLFSPPLQAAGSAFLTQPRPLWLGAVSKVFTGTRPPPSRSCHMTLTLAAVPSPSLASFRGRHCVLSPLSDSDPASRHQPHARYRLSVAAELSTDFLTPYSAMSYGIFY